jgi:chromosomal replication initiator protein
VVDLVAKSFNLTADRLMSRDRSQAVALPRQIAMYLMRREIDISLPQIGKEIGGRDHSTVMYAIDKVTDLLERDERLRRQVVQIRQKLHSQPVAM